MERIGALSAEEAMRRTTRLVHHDNEQQIRGQTYPWVMTAVE